MTARSLMRRVAVRLGLIQRPPPPQPDAFDAAWYSAQLVNADDAKSPWAHYVATGWRQGLSPSPLFDGARYLRLYPDIGAAAMNPFIHYLTLGWREDRSPHPLFNHAWYARQRNPDVDPLTDYLTTGWREGCSPHPLFHVAHYRAQRGGAPACADLVDYLRSGWQSGFDPHPYFSIGHYRRSAALDPAAEPLVHYVETGFRAAHEPHPTFDPDFYRARYLLAHRDPPNPLIDFVTTGWVLDRKPRADAPAGWRAEAFRLLGPQRPAG